MALMAENICLHISGFNLLRDVSMRVEPGTVTAIVGPNGAGKSSLLKVLTGEMTATSGKVNLNHQPLNTWGLEHKAKMLAVLPQHTALNFPFTADEVVALGRIPHQTGKLKDELIVADALKAVDASYLQKRFYTRVLAQIWEPTQLGDQFLVLDEPTSAFDLSHQKLTLEIVRGLAQQGTGVVMVLHDLNLAARCADNLVVFDRGTIAAQGSPEEVLTEALISQGFGVKSIIAKHPVTQKPLVIT